MCWPMRFASMPDGLPPAMPGVFGLRVYSLMAGMDLFCICCFRSAQ